MDFPEDMRLYDFVKDAAEEALVTEAFGGSPNIGGEALARQLLQKFM
jgi:hypothetical protein